MTHHPQRSRISRRHLIGGVAATGALAWLPAAAQDDPPVIEPIDGQPIEPDPAPEPIAPETPEESNGAVIEPVEGVEGEFRYFAETGHNLDEPFLSVWRAAGGERVLGRPLSEERFDEAAGVVEQYFQGIVLVNAPDSSGQWRTTGAPLGNVRTAAAAPADAREPVSGCSGGDCEFFPETGHTVAGRLAVQWRQLGGVAIFGLPVSEPFERGGATVQVFENAILRFVDDGIACEPIVGELIVDLGLENDAAFLPAPPTLGTTTLVRASDGLRLRGGPSTDAEVIAVLEDNAEFIAVSGASGTWVPGYADGYSGYVAAEYLAAPEELPSFAVGGQWDPSVWQGVALSETNIRAEPTTASRIVRTVPYGEPVRVQGWVRGETVEGGTYTWAQLDDGTYLYERNVGRAGPVEPTPVPDDAPWEGKWIDCNLTQQLLIAYEGRNPVRVAVTTTGKPGWETPPGYYLISVRVENETMESGAIGAEEFYRLENVLYTQYFTDRGHALHYAWWKTPETIGRPGSHGCLNLLLDDSEFFWRWAGIGTPVYCHY